MSAQKLSARLQAVAGLVRTKGILADIGCDHAYIPIELIRRGQIRYAIASDVRPGPLSVAEENIRSAGMQDSVSTRISDGLASFSPGEADSFVIAGMGGRLIASILEEGKEVLAAADELILEPQSEPETVRRMLGCIRTGRGGTFRIADETLVFEDGHYYPVIRAEASHDTERLQPEELMFGPVLLAKKDPVLHTYLRERRAVLEGIADKLHVRMNDTLTCRVSTRLDQVQLELYLIRAALGRYGEE